MAKWRTLDLRSFDGSLSWCGRDQTLVCAASNGDAVAAAPCDCAVLLLGERAQVSSGTLQALARRDVTVVLCDWKGAPVATLAPHVGQNGRVCARHRAQAHVSEARLGRAWQTVVRAKLQHQAAALDKVGRRAKGSALRALAKEVRPADSANVEGRGARVYWAALFGDDFRRAPGAGVGGPNSMLDYGYAVLRAHCSRAVLTAGLAPELGMHHKGRGDSFALADDLMEPFRPVVDLRVAAMGSCDIGEKGTRRALVECCLGRFSTDGATIPTAMGLLAARYASFIEGGSERLEVPEWEPQ